MGQIGRVERQVRRADSFQQRHAVIAFPWAVMQKFGNDQAGGKATFMAYYGLFALFPLLLLFATLLGFALRGNAALREADRFGAGKLSGHRGSAALRGAPA